jgi:competence protein ComEA
LIEIDRAKPLDADYLVDVNRAEWPEFAQLPGIGETMGRRIVESRQSQGPFMDLNELQRVRGIGPRTLERIRPYLAPMPNASTTAGR